MSLAYPTRIISNAFARLAGSGFLNTVPEQPTVGDNRRASYSAGFPQQTMTPTTLGGVNPYGQDFNGILNDITQNIAHQTGGGLYKFDAAFVAANSGYRKGAIIESNDETRNFKSLVDNNTVNPNTATGLTFSNNWRLFGDPIPASAGLPTYTELQLWDLTPVGVMVPYFESVVGLSLADFLIAKPKFRHFEAWSGFATAGLRGTSFAGRSILHASNSFPVGTRDGSYEATLQQHTHTVPGTNHSHLYKDIFFSENPSFVTNSGNAGSLAIPGAMGQRSGSDNDNRGFFDERLTNNATIPAQVTTQAGSVQPDNNNLHPIVAVNHVIRVQF